MSIQYFENSSFVDLDTIYASIRNEGFSNHTISLIDNYVNQMIRIHLDFTANKFIL